MLLLLLLLLSLQFHISSCFKFLVNITNGQVEGFELVANYSIFGEQTGIVFLGIPHIEPPLRDLRFRKPKPFKTKWPGVLETKAFKPACMSDPVKSYERPEGGPVSEDCLYLNVLTNSYCLEHKNCSVMVATHGGFMIRKATATFPSDVIVNNYVARNIVVVTLPYRLGIFGLPNIDGDMEGNADTNLILHDIIEGLEWVQREISNFGGLPHRVTFFGHSGGGTISAILSMMKQCDHLFHQRVSLSPPILFHSNYTNSKIFGKVAKHVGCDVSSPTEELFSCMRNVSATQLFESQDHVFHAEEEYFADFAIDGELLTDNVRSLLRAGNYTSRPMIIGTTPFEIKYTQYFVDDSGNVRMDKLIEFCDMFAYLGSFENPVGFVEKCIEFYEDKNHAPWFLDHLVFHIPTILQAKQNAISKPVYLYSYSYSGAGAAYKKYDPALTPAHSEDLMYYMGVQRTENFTERDMEIEKILTGFLADFVNSGVPNGENWTKVNPEIMNYYQIDFDDNLNIPGMRNNFHEEEFKFWNETAPKAGGNFTYASNFSKFYDVIPAIVLTEAENMAITKNWDGDKTKNISRVVTEEIAKFINQKKLEHQSTSPANNCLFTLTIITFIFNM